MFDRTVLAAPLFLGLDHSMVAAFWRFMPINCQSTAKKGTLGLIGIITTAFAAGGAPWIAKWKEHRIKHGFRLMYS
jgi:hypothetical protein